MTPGERKSGKNNDSWFDVEVKRFGEDEPYIDPDPGIPEIPGKEQRVRELEAIKKRVSAKGWFPAGRMNPQAPKPRMGPHHANMNEGDGDEGKFVAMPRGLYTQPMKRGSYNAPGILIGQSIRNAPPSSPVVVRQRVVKTAHVKVRVNTKEKKEGAEGEGAEGAEGEGAEGEGAETETPKPKEEPKKPKQKPPSPDRPWRTPHKVKPLSPPKDYNEAMRDKLAALSTANKLRKEEEAKTAPSLPPGRIPTLKDAQPENHRRRASRAGAERPVRRHRRVQVRNLAKRHIRRGGRVVRVRTRGLVRGTLTAAKARSVNAKTQSVQAAGNQTTTKQADVRAEPGG